MRTFNQSLYLALWRSLNPGAHIMGGFGPVPQKNLLDRADCESTTPPALNGQTANTLVACTFARSVIQKRGGASSYLFTKTGGVGVLAQAFLGGNTGFNGLKATAYTFNAWLYVPAAGFGRGQPYIAIGYVPYTGTGTVENIGYYSGPTDTWVQLNANLIIPKDATAIYAYVGAIAAAGNFTFYVDDLTFYDLLDTPMLPGATLNVYDGRQPQDANTALGTDNHLGATFTFPPEPQSNIGPKGINSLEPLPTTIALRSTTPDSPATWVRCLNSLGAPMFDCSVSSDPDDMTDLIISQNPFTIGQALSIRNGNPVPFVSIPTLGNSVAFREQ